MRTTKDYEAHKDHLGQTRWMIEHRWSVETEDGIWDHNLECGTEFSSKDEAKHAARNGFADYQAALLTEHRKPLEYHVEVRMVRWRLDKFLDPEYGVILDVIDDAQEDPINERQTARLYADEDKWEEG